MNRDLPTKTTARKDGVHNEARWDPRVYREARVDRHWEQEREHTEMEESEWERGVATSKQEWHPEEEECPAGSQAPVDLGHECLHKVVEHKPDGGWRINGRREGQWMGLRSGFSEL